MLYINTDTFTHTHTLSLIYTHTYFALVLKPKQIMFVLGQTGFFLFSKPMQDISE